LLLNFLVEEKLRGNAEFLKERNIGVEVFKRDAAYDTNSDPVVRMAVTEIRKKLAQYYCEPGHQEQLRIKLPTGSYIPSFLLPEVILGEDFPHHQEPSRNEGETPKQIPAFDLFHSPRWRSRSAKFALITICVLAVSAAILAEYTTMLRSRFDVFWSPILNSPRRALLCVGEMESPSASILPPGSVWGDSIALADTAGLLRSYEKSYSIRGATATSYIDLQQGPVILVGAFNNDWTKHFIKPLRFQFNQRIDSLEQ